MAVLAARPIIEESMHKECTIDARRLKLAAKLVRWMYNIRFGDTCNVLHRMMLNALAVIIPGIRYAK